jgi:hypothetical protein
MAGDGGQVGAAHREAGDQDDGLQLRKGSMRRCDGEWPARRRASRGNSRGGHERAEGDSCDGQPRKEAHSAMHGARAGRGGMLDGVNMSNTSGRKGPHRRSRDEMVVGRGVAVGGEAPGFALLLFISFLALFPLGCSGQKAIEYTSQVMAKPIYNISSPHLPACLLDDYRIEIRVFCCAISFYAGLGWAGLPTALI